jgi:hypothetical protein
MPSGIKKSCYLEIFIVEYNKRNVSLIVRWRKTTNKMDKLCVTFFLDIQVDQR